MKSNKIRVADYIANYIYDIGVKYVCLLSGGGAMFLNDGLACHKKLKKVCFHHEQGAAMAIDAYARYNNHFAVGYFTTGPGAINALTGTAGAYLDSTPCLFISGQVKRREATYAIGIKGLRQCGVQEIDIIPMVESITNYAAFVDKPENIRYHLEKAFYLAKNGRPGPVWLDIPLDVQGSMINPKRLKGFKPKNKKIKVLNKDLDYMVSRLKKSKRPLILAGYGIRISGAIKNFKQLANQYKIPVVTTFLGVDMIEENNPQYIGRIGIKGTRAGNLAIQNSDLLIVIGSSLPIAEIGYEYHAFAREATKVVIDIEPCSHMKKTIKIDKIIQADADDFLNKLLKRLKKEKLSFDKKWPNICLKWKKSYPVCLPEYAKRKNRINIYYFIDKLSDRLKAGDVVVTDAGSSFYAGSQAVKIKKGVRYITSGGFATMGYGLPASIGASLAIGEKRVMCVTGDGSFQQNIQELQTVVHYKLPIKIFILNNEGYLSIRTTQKKFFQRYLGEGPKSGVSFPDHKKIAKAYGIKYVKADKNKNLKKALDKTLNCKGAVICEVMTPKDQLIIPNVSSKKRKDGSLVSKPFEDMFPFLKRKEFLSNMMIEPLKEE